jgi:hypothetical protein
VSGLEHTQIVDVDMSVDFSHQYATDVDILLVHGETNLVVMSDVGSAIAANNLSLTFHDDARTSMPSDGMLSGGEFRPTNYTDTTEGVGSFPAPAPVASTNTKLAAFNGFDLNGTWQLYVSDDAGVGSGDLFGSVLKITVIPGPDAGPLQVISGTTPCTNTSTTASVAVTGASNATRLLSP